MADKVANPNWTKAENWAWARIAAGQVAGFAAEPDDLDLRGPRKREPGRTLSADFLRAILFERAWTEQVPADGVRITGARWAEPLLIPHARLAWPLCLDACRFDAEVDMSDLTIGGRLSFARSAFHGGGKAMPGLRLDMAAAQRADLSDGYFRHGATAADAIFAGTLEFSRAQLEGGLDLSRTKARCIRMREAATAAILLSNCEVDQDLDLSGASVGGPLKMNDAQIGQDLWLGGSKQSVARFAEAIDLTGARVDGIFSMCGVVALGTIDMRGMEVKKNVFMREPKTGDDERETGETVFVAGIDLSYASIHGHLDMCGVQVGAASFLGARISGTLFLSGAQLQAGLDLRDARLGGDLLMYAEDKVQARCLGELALQNATIGGSVALGGAFEGALPCTGLRAGSLFARSGAGSSTATPVFKKSIELNHATIDGICDFDDARVEAGISLERAKIGGDLRLRCQFAAPAAERDAAGAEPPPPVVDLSASTIEGELMVTLPLASHEAGRDHHLHLRDSRVGSLQVSGPASDTPWPKAGSVQLDGLTFDRFRTIDIAKGEDSVSWLRQWLELDKPFSPQPYEQIVSVLRQAGQTDEANQILYEARERVRRESWSRDLPLWGFPRWLGLGLLKITIGYGIGLRFFRALLWAIVLTAIGVAVLQAHPPLATSTTRLDGLGDLIAYSFDQLLPIITLSKSFDDVKLAHQAEQYFYVLRIFGFLLGSFIAAGIAGLTQRSRS